MAMALHAPADDFAVQHVEGGDQCGRAVALVVVRHRAGAAALHGRVVERLDLALLVDRQHHRVGGRIDVEPDDLSDLGCEGGAQPLGGDENDPGTPDVLLRAVAVRDHGFKQGAVRGGHVDDKPWAHRPDSHAINATGIRSRTLPVALPPLATTASVSR